MSTFRPLLRAPYLLTSPLRHRTFSTVSPLQSSSVARISLIGRLAAEAELTATSDGTDMIRYSLATSYGSKENRRTSWWKIASFAGEGRGRDLLLSLGKGSMLFVEGDAQMNQFKDKSGNNQNSVSITQRRFEVLDRRDKLETGEGETGEGETGEGETGEGEIGEGKDRQL